MSFVMFYGEEVVFVMILSCDGVDTCDEEGNL